ncbi:hypothetical protein [Bradyrhizobium arachidis]|uniref:hypothetical protein n=1 Tax=Bradyrhizobium arachidis TaxID=858423 RepID=UPI002162D7BB|nr:hypothetical protein [Bradyrhizobium arachidis]UVO28172.1 hypothetical protein KUF59_37835 [Bradyrhizobium arachidis]
MAFAVDLIKSICAFGVDPDFTVSVDGTGSIDSRLVFALRANNTADLFDWMMDSFSFQGSSDSVAHSYLDLNGNATWRTIKSRLPLNQPALSSRAIGLSKVAATIRRASHALSPTTSHVAPCRVIPCAMVD